VEHIGGNGRGPGGHNGNGQRPEGFPKKRNSVWPLLVDVGVVSALIGLILIRPMLGELIGNVVIGGGLVLFVVALIGWIREARADYANLPD
jgi:hypothetical protein